MDKRSTPTLNNKVQSKDSPLKGGDPSTASATDALLRLRSGHRSRLKPCKAGISSVTDFPNVTGGEYKARERIHRGELIHDY